MARIGLVACAWLGLALPGAAQRISYEGGVQASSGRYLFTERNTTVSFATGLSVIEGPVSFRLSWPLWLHDDRLVTSSGIGAIPTGGNRAGMAVGDSSAARRMRHGGRTGAVAPPSEAITGHELHVADPVLQMGVRLVSSSAVTLRVTAAVKVPVADTATVGTGAWDAGGGVSVSIPSGRMLVGLDLGYWHFGDLPDVDLRDAASGSLSVGRVAASGWGWMATGSGSTTIIPGFDPPVTVGAALSRVTGRGLYGLSIALGLTEMAADVSVGSFWSIRF